MKRKIFKMRLTPTLLFAVWTLSSILGQTYTIKTVVGSGGLPENIQGLSANLPDAITGICVDSTKNVFVSLYYEGVVLRLDSKTGILTRVAGNWTQGFSGDAGPAASAQLNYPQGLALDSSGNLYIADWGNNRIRRVSNGVITTVAGGGTAGSGDGGPATSANIAGVAQIAVDGSFNLYMADGARVRKVDTNGTITTVAGNGTYGATGDGGPATNAEIDGGSVAADAAGNLYIAGAVGVRKVSNGLITTVAGGGSAFPGNGGPATSAQVSASSPTVDAAGNLYFADSRSLIRKVDNNGIITTVAGNGSFGDTGDGGPATNATLAVVLLIAADPGGDLFLASGFDNHIRELSNGVITTLVGGSPAGDYNGPAAGALLNAPGDVVADRLGSIYVADALNNRVRKVSNGQIAPFAGNGTAGFSGDGGSASSAALAIPGHLALDSHGNVYVADLGNKRIRKVDTNGNITTVAGNGSEIYSGDGSSALSTGFQLGGFDVSGPQKLIDSGIAVDVAGNLYICSHTELRMVDPAAVITTLAHFSGNPLCIVLENSGVPYVVTGLALMEIANGVISPVMAVDGVTGQSVPLGFQSAGAAFDSQGNLYISSYASIERVSGGVITRVAGNGTVGHSGDGGPATSAQLAGPSGITVDPSGNIYFVDSGNSSIRVLNPSGPACAYSISSRYIAVPSAGGTITAAVQTSSSCTWAISGLPNWATQSSSTIKMGTSTANLLIAPLSGIARSATVSIAGFSVVVTQQGTIGSPSVTAINNAASNVSGAVAPGEIVTITGSGLGPSPLVSAHVGSDGLYDTALAGTSVQFNGIPAPMIYTSATQVAAIVPYEITGTSVPVTVTYQGQTSAATLVVVAASAPAIFTLDSTGQGQAAAVNQNGSINTTSAPALIGSIVSLYATGEGQTTPLGVNGKPATVPLPKPNLPVSVTIGGQTVSAAQIQYAGGAPGLVAGLLQVNVQIPSGVTPGNAVPIAVSVGGKTSQASVTLAVAATTGSQSLAVTSLSTTSPTSLTPLYIETVGLDTAAAITIHFSNNAGFSFTEQPIRVASDGTVVAAVPLYYDASTYKVGPGTVSMVLTQGKQSTLPIIIAIQDLPSVSSYGTKPGQISHAFLVYEALLIGRRLNELQAYQVIPGNKVDTSQAQTSLRALLNSFIEARSDVDYVSANQNLVISGGTHSNGFPIQFDQNSLDLMDRIIGQHLSQIATVVSSVTQLASLPSGGTSRLSARLPKENDGIALKVKAEASSTTNPNMATVLNVIEGATNQIALEQAISDSQDQDGTWADKVLAAAGGVGSLYNQVTLGTEGRQATAGTEFGAVVSAVSLINNVVMESYDLGLVALAPDSPKANQAANDLYKRANDSTYAAINVELGLLTLANPEFLKLNQFASAGLKSLALVSAVEQCYSTSCYSNLDTSSLQLAAETPTILSSSTLGFGIVGGTAQIPYSSGMVSPGQNEVQVSSNGVMFSGIADENGAFQLFVPLQADPFTYATADLQIVDPITQNTLNTIDLRTGKADSLQVVDLSRLNTHAPLVLPTIKVLADCSDSEDTCFKQCSAIWDADNTLQGVENQATCVLRCQAGYNSCSAAQAGTGAPALSAGLSRPRIGRCSPK
jgi:uncharacterized protein (TIGR03437 family)